MLGGSLITALGAKFIKQIGMGLNISLCELYQSNIWTSFINGEDDRSIRKVCPLLQRLSSLIPPQVNLVQGAEDSMIWILG